MVAVNLTRSLEQLFGHEGGYSTDRNDPGNWTGGKVGKGVLKGTKFGIAANSYGHLDIKNLTLSKAAEIYRRDYAAKIRYDDLPSGIDHTVFDYSVNSGPSRAAKHLQRVVGVTEDGKIGPATLTSIHGFHVEDVINGLCDVRLAFLQGLPTWERYKNGWTRRVGEVREFGLKLAEERPHEPSRVPVATPKPVRVGFFTALLRWLKGE